MIHETKVYEIRCDGCGKRWGEAEEPEKILWEPTPEGIDQRFQETEEARDTEIVDKWEREAQRPVGGAPAVICFHYCPDCQE